MNKSVSNTNKRMCTRSHIIPQLFHLMSFLNQAMFVKNTFHFNLTIMLWSLHLHL